MSVPRMVFESGRVVGSSSAGRWLGAERIFAALLFFSQMVDALACITIVPWPPRGAMQGSQYIVRQSLFDIYVRG